MPDMSGVKARSTKKFAGPAAEREVLEGSKEDGPRSFSVTEKNAIEEKKGTEQEQKKERNPGIESWEVLEARSWMPWAVSCPVFFKSS